MNFVNFVSLYLGISGRIIGWGHFKGQIWLVVANGVA